MAEWPNLSANSDLIRIVLITIRAPPTVVPLFTVVVVVAAVVVVVAAVVVVSVARRWTRYSNACSQRRRWLQS